jgi:hypothetical protein
MAEAGMHSLSPSSFVIAMTFGTKQSQGRAELSTSLRLPSLSSEGLAVTHYYIFFPRFNIISLQK